MLSIDCPYCGARDEVEFINGGEGHVVRPGHPDTLSDAAWSAYLFYHDNPRGMLSERWLHEYGCRRWFHAVRDTVTHAIIRTYPIDASGMVVE